MLPPWDRHPAFLGQQSISVVCSSSQTGPAAEMVGLEVRLTSRIQKVQSPSATIRVPQVVGWQYNNCKIIKYTWVFQLMFFLVVSEIIVLFTWQRSSMLSSDFDVFSVLKGFVITLVYLNNPSCCHLILALVYPLICLPSPWRSPSAPPPCFKLFFIFSLSSGRDELPSLSRYSCNGQPSGLST